MTGMNGLSELKIVSIQRVKQVNKKSTLQQVARQGFKVKGEWKVFGIRIPRI
jgi:hypothetical protein